jgi:hypothetical protein
MRIFGLFALLCLGLAGCANDAGNAVKQFAATGAPASGKILSGTAPVSGAHVYLMGVAATGYGKPSVSLLDEGSTGYEDSVGAYVVTAADGSFTIPGTYSCSAATDVYVYTLGGDSGMGNNSAASELAAIGSCPPVGTDVPPFVVNEVSTVAMSFALAGFAGDALHISSSGTPLAVTGVQNAFVNASNLVPTATGVAAALIPSGSATVPQATINTLANILFSCIHSAGPGSTSCAALLNNAGSAPPYSDTASAMIAIAHNPASNVPALYAQQSTPQFAPYLTTAPNDFSLGLVFTGGGINLTVGMAVDAMGNVWSISNGDTRTNYNLYVTEISSAGAFLSGPNGYLSGQQVYEIGSLGNQGPIAVDTLGNVWIGIGGNSGGGSLWELSSTGTVLFKSGGVVTSLSSGYDGLYPYALAIDANNNLWVADDSKVDEFSSSGQLLSETKGFTGGGMDIPDQLAISPSGDVWIANRMSDTISELSSSGAPLSPSTGIGVPAAAVAIDHQGNVWAAGCCDEPKVSKVSPSGAILSGSGFVGGGIGGVGDGGAYIAIDGDGNAWIPLYGYPGVVELSSSGAPLSGATGYTSGIATGQANTVIDGSGDVWSSSATFAPSKLRGVPGVYTFEIIETIGIAAPVVTPLAAGVQHNMLGARP